MIREANIRRNKDSDREDAESGWGEAPLQNEGEALKVDTQDHEEAADQDSSPQDTGYSSATDVQEPMYSNGVEQANPDLRMDRYENVRMSPIREEESVRQEIKVHDGKFSFRLGILTAIPCSSKSV